MIILILLNWLESLAYNIANLIWVNSIPVFDSLTTWFTNISVPQTVYNIFSFTAYFLPMGTVHILIGFTSLIIFFKILVSLIHFITLGKVE